MKVFVAVPAYDGSLRVETARALLNEQVLALARDHVLEVAFLPGCSLITQARNQLAQDFLDSDCDRLFFLDSDVSWDVGALLRIALHPVALVGGAYRYKADEEGYPVAWLDQPELWADPQTGLLEVNALPGGFLAIDRSVLERLRDAHPDRAYHHFGRDYQGWFHAPIEGGKMFGEDSAFCFDWHELGGQVWLDPEVRLTHVGGVNRYAGCIGDWLRGRIVAELATTASAA